jgi:hypothetical protein
MMKNTTRVLTAIAIGLTVVGSVSQASAQSAPYRHSRGHVERNYQPYQPSQGSSQYPDYSRTGSGYSRGGCSDSPAEC